MSLSQPTPTTVALAFPLGLVAAVAATLVMDVVMARLPEGTTPPSVASGVLTERPPDEAPGRLASVVHYLAGWLTGPLFVWFLFAAAMVLGPHTPATLALTAVALYVLMVGFFVGVVLPRSLLAAERVGAVRRDWALSAAAYLLVLAPLVVAGTTVLPA